MALLFPKWASLAILALSVASFLTTEAKPNGLGLGIFPRGKPQTQREFDYFALALQWPATYCRRSRHCCTSNACCRGSNAPAEFTIHGLWPDYNDGSWPSCCTNKRFNEKEISTLLGDLEKYWPSLSCGSPSTCHGGKGSFWGHEWEKHGTCSAPVTGDEYNYFSTVLNIYFKYNVSRVLSEEGYVPSDSEKYPIGGIISAIQNAFHTTPLIVCKNGAIEELRLCFYKNFEPRDCVTQVTNDNMVSSRNSCPKYVSLPAHTSRGVNGAETKIPWIPAKEAIQEHESM
ncbi:ribonuclease 2-like [Humulus lupulus]|uniref:ribonuclease 2-like n=1 Tax=Humulus lupulus TaxID=3486 RepID=UPI002B400ADE|nr:ribonuclease 2-like [Humulus lupulus]